MLDPTSALSNIYAVAKLIYAQVQLVKANQNVAKMLSIQSSIIKRDIEYLNNFLSSELSINSMILRKKFYVFYR
jgi:NADH/NAD ratio-sensing transcriptional regulator Rex